MVDVCLQVYLLYIEPTQIFLELLRIYHPRVRVDLVNLRISKILSGYYHKVELQYGGDQTNYSYFLKHLLYLFLLS